MRVFNVQQVARPTPGDRNPLDILFSYFPGPIGPHADTTRFIYTVPANRKIQNGLAVTGVGRYAAATTPNDYQVYTSFTKSGGGAGIITIDQRNNNARENLSPNAIANVGDLLAGDVWQTHTSDISIGGTVQYASSFKATEYDA